MLSDLLLRRLVRTSGIPVHDDHRQPRTIDGLIAAAGTGGSQRPRGRPRASDQRHPATIENTAAGTAQRESRFAANRRVARGRHPSDASAGTYEGTLALTTAPPVSG